MLEKLKSLEEKIIVGGENLLAKAELQEKLLAESAAELEARRYGLNLRQRVISFYLINLNL